ESGVHLELGAEHSDWAGRAGWRVPGLRWAAAGPLPRLGAGVARARADVLARLAGPVHRAGLAAGYAGRRLSALGAYAAAHADHPGRAAATVDRYATLSIPPAAAAAAGHADRPRAHQPAGRLLLL